MCVVVCFGVDFDVIEFCVFFFIVKGICKVVMDY